MNLGGSNYNFMMKRYESETLKHPESIMKATESYAKSLLTKTEGYSGRACSCTIFY